MIRKFLCYWEMVGRVPQDGITDDGISIGAIPIVLENDGLLVPRTNGSPTKLNPLESRVFALLRLKGDNLPHVVQCEWDNMQKGVPLADFVALNPNIRPCANGPCGGLWTKYALAPSCYNEALFRFLF